MGRGVELEVKKDKRQHLSSFVGQTTTNVNAVVCRRRGTRPALIRCVMWRWVVVLAVLGHAVVVGGGG
jgi:hypothetical protein